MQGPIGSVRSSWDLDEIRRNRCKFSEAGDSVTRAARAGLDKLVSRSARYSRSGLPAATVEIARVSPQWGQSRTKSPQLRPFRILAKLGASWAEMEPKLADIDPISSIPGNKARLAELG